MKAPGSEYENFHVRLPSKSTQAKLGLQTQPIMTTVVSSHTKTGTSGHGRPLQQVEHPTHEEDLANSVDMVPWD